MTPSRRDFLRGCGALIVSFGAAPFTASSARAQGQFQTHPGHIDPDRLDSWLAIGADGAITAYTEQVRFPVRASLLRRANSLQRNYACPSRA